MPRQNRLFNDELVKQLIDYIKVGNYVNTACAAVGIGEATYHKWLRDGLAVEEGISGLEDEEELKDRMEKGELVRGYNAVQVRSWLFRLEIQRATAMGEAYAVAMIRTQMPGQWQAAMAFLERRHPTRWRRRDQLNIGEIIEETGVGIDESLLLQDPKAVELIHEALAAASRKELPVADAEVVGDDKEAPDSSGASE